MFRPDCDLRRADMAVDLATRQASRAQNQLKRAKNDLSFVIGQPRRSLITLSQLGWLTPHDARALNSMNFWNGIVAEDNARLQSDVLFIEPT